jgi:hypothetical protein
MKEGSARGNGDIAAVGWSLEGCFPIADRMAACARSHEAAATVQCQCSASAVPVLVQLRPCNASAADLHVFQKIVRLRMDDNGGGGCSRLLLLQLGQKRSDLRADVTGQ